MTTALYIGRFQPFHLGHLHYIKKILSENDRLIIAIGSSQEKGTAQNPLSAMERKRIIAEALSEDGLAGRISIIFARDYPGDNKTWLDRITSRARFDRIYAGDNNAVYEIFSKAGYNTHMCKRYKGISSTAIRRYMAEDREWRHLVPGAVYNILRPKGR